MKTKSTIYVHNLILKLVKLILWQSWARSFFSFSKMIFLSNIVKVEARAKRLKNSFNLEDWNEPLKLAVRFFFFRTILSNTEHLGLDDQILEFLEFSMSSIFETMVLRLVAKKKNFFQRSHTRGNLWRKKKKEKKTSNKVEALKWDFNLLRSNDMQARQEFFVKLQYCKIAIVLSIF